VERVCRYPTAVRKSKGLVTLTSTSLGPTAAREQREEEEEEKVPPHLMMPVDVHKGKNTTGFLPYLALVNSGTTYNYVY
jgi:hypothetical protein